MGNKQHKKDFPKIKKGKAQDDSVINIRKTKSKISLEDSGVNNIPSQNNEILPHLNTDSNTDMNKRNNNIANDNDNNEVNNHYPYYNNLNNQPVQREVNSQQPIIPIFSNEPIQPPIKQEQTNYHPHQFNQPNQISDNLNEIKYYSEDINNNKIQGPQRIIPQNNNQAINHDYNRILECIKKCDSKYQEGCQLVQKKEYKNAQECFMKTKQSLNQLVTIIKNKPNLSNELVQSINNQLIEKISYANEALKQCIPLAQKQQQQQQQQQQQMIADQNRKYKSQMVQSSAHNYQRNSSNPQSAIKNKKADDESKDAFEQKIENEILVKDPGVKFSDIVGMKDLKQIIYEIVILPTVRPDLFTGLRKPQRGLLLFGPPGTGKTMIAKAVASECSSTFFNISASSLTSKWIGESEKTVRGLFQLAYKRSPSIIFIDEIESILSKRSENDNEAAKRLKTEFLIQFDGLSTNSDSKLLVIAATNRPMDLDDALLRRLPKRVYCGPLDFEGRADFIRAIMQSIDNKLSQNDMKQIAQRTENYSNSDLKELCRDAAYQPVRELSDNQIDKIKKLRPIILQDFMNAINTIRGTITKPMLSELDCWNRQFGVLD